MTSPISALNSLNAIAPGPTPVAKMSPQSGEVDFQKLLFDSLSQVNQLEHKAQENIETRLMGGDITSSEVYTSLRKADLAMKMLIQVRNKLVSSFQEIQQMRM